MKKQEVILDNGLTIIVQPTESKTICTLSYLVNVGSDNESYEEDNDERGITHFIEHLLFKGTKNRTYKEINKCIENLGGYLNAETDNLYTKYYCTMPIEEWKTGLDVLSDMIFNNLIPEEQFENEKSVVIEELKMYDDDPASFITSKLKEKMNEKYLNRQSIGGTVNSVKNITRKQVINFIDKYYNPDNMIVSITGELDINEVKDFLSNYINELNLKFNKTDKLIKRYDYTKIDSNEKIFHFEKKDIQQTHLAWGLRCGEVSNKDIFGLMVLNIILGGNSCSRMYNVIREEKGLCYTITTYLELFCIYKEIIQMGYTGLNSENESIEDIINIISKQYIDIKNELNEEDINSNLIDEISGAKKYLSGIINLKNETTSGINEFITELIVNKLYDKFDKESILNEIENVSIEKLKDIVNKYFIVDNIYFTILN